MPAQLALVLLATCAVAFIALSVIGFRLLRRSDTWQVWHAWVGPIVIALALWVALFACITLGIMFLVAIDPSGNLLPEYNSTSLALEIGFPLLLGIYLIGGLIAVYYGVRLNSSLHEYALAKDRATARQGSNVLLWISVFGLFVGSVSFPISLLFPKAPTIWGAAISLVGVALAIVALLTRWLTWAVIAPAIPSTTDGKP